MANSEEVVGASSPLYQRYAEYVLSIPESERRSNILFSIFNAVEPSKHQPSLLLAAVQLEVLKGRKHPPLSRYYNLYGALPDQRYGQILEEFCVEHGKAIQRTMRERVVAVNEVNRNGIFAPLLGYINRLENQKVALIEPGACAGLNQFIDLFHYQIMDMRSDGKIVFGEARSGVEVQTIYSQIPHQLEPMDVPSLGVKLGFDIWPLDVSRDEDRDWILASVWVGDRQRLMTYAGAILTVGDSGRHPVVRQGDVLDLLESASRNWLLHLGRYDVMTEIPKDQTPVFLFSYLLTWLEPAIRERVMTELERIGRRRPIYAIMMEQRGVVPFYDQGVPPKEEAAVFLLRFDSEGTTCLVKGTAHPHGRSCSLEVVKDRRRPSSGRSRPLRSRLKRTSSGS